MCIRDSPNGNAVSGAVVQLTANSPDFSICQMAASAAQSVQTDSAGKFSFSNVNIGPVSVTATKSLYPTPAGASGVLATNNGSVNFALQFINTVSGTLSGNIYLPDGITPAPNVQVTATGPVSYTHLDVYKRQSPHNSRKVSATRASGASAG